MNSLLSSHGPAVAAFASLVAIQVTVGIVYKLAQTDGKYSFSQASALTLAEGFKLLLSITFYAESKGRMSSYTPLDPSPSQKSWLPFDPFFLFKLNFRQISTSLLEEVEPRTMRGMFLLSVLYAFNNHAAFFIFKFVDPGTITLIKSGSTFISAVILWIFLSRKNSGLQWLAISLQVLGLIISQYDECHQAGTYPVSMYALMLFSVTISAASGVINEYLCKSTAASLHALNIFLYSSGFIINLACHVIFLVFTDDEPFFFSGYNGFGLGIVACNSLIGLAITAVYKYANAIVKCIAQSTATAILLAVSVILFAVPIRLIAMAGIAVIFISTYIYFTNPYKASDTPIVTMIMDKKEEGDDDAKHLLNQPGQLSRSSSGSVTPQMVQLVVKDAAEKAQ